MTARSEPELLPARGAGPAAPLADAAALRVLIAVATCNRPAELRALMLSLGAMAPSGNVRAELLVVENSPRRNAHAVVAEQPVLFGRNVMFLVEPECGIPFARNAALDAAVSGPFDFLAFVDDDEVVDPDWLEMLVGRYREAPAELIGGPAYACAPAAGLTRWQRYLARGYERWYQVRQRRNRREAGRGRGDSLVVVTNNWLLDLAFARRTGIRFSPAFRISGGSDSDFCARLRKLGGRTGWSMDAVVREVIVPARLTARYIFFRGMQQRINHAERHRDRGVAARLVLPLLIFAPVLAYGFARIALAPLVGPYSLLDGVRSCGRAFGGVFGAFGARSRLYKLGT